MDGFHVALFLALPGISVIVCLEWCICIPIKIYDASCLRMFQENKVARSMNLFRLSGLQEMQSNITIRSPWDQEFWSD